MSLTLVEKQRKSFVADQQLVIEKNLLKQLKKEIKRQTLTFSVVPMTCVHRS